VFPLRGTGSANVSYTVFPNFSTASRSATFTIAGRTFQITQAANTASADHRFVELLYFNFLGRLPTAAERELQVTQGLRPPATRADLTMNFLTGEEFNTGGRFIAGLYVGLLDRDAEYDGWLFQRNALSTSIVNHDRLVENFISAEEYRLKFGTPDDPTFVRLLYRHILMREPSQPEVDHQVAALRALNAGNHNGRVIIARNFLSSAEFRAGTGPRLTSFLLYATLLQRDGSQPEREFREHQLSPPASTPLKTLVLDFLAAPEFERLLR
jgi:hypothetical protein